MPRPRTHGRAIPRSGIPPGFLVIASPPFLGFPGGGQGRSIGEATLYAGMRLWKGAELWINPEIDQGLGLGNSIGVGAT